MLNWSKASSLGESLEYFSNELLTVVFRLEMWPEGCSRTNMVLNGCYYN